MVEHSTEDHDIKGRIKPLPSTKKNGGVKQKTVTLNVMTLNPCAVMLSAIYSAIVISLS
jgi:hypothetical protein